MSLKVFERYLARNPVAGILDFSVATEMIVVIPVLNDRDIFRTLDSLCVCKEIDGEVGVVVVVDHSENEAIPVKEANLALAAELKEYVSRLGKWQFRIVEAFDLPAKFAGVGLARKIGMDLAAEFFYRQGKERAPILSLDADTLVGPDYFQETLRCFRTRDVSGVSIAYAHRLEECKGRAREAMVKYELYLRYYRLALKYTGHPHAFHCIGSAFAVRVADYVAQGGMNKRQAGEDFYFIQKLISTGRYAELNTTKVYPSPRFSERTPFGTGRSLKQIVGNQGAFPVYRFDVFQLLRSFFQNVNTLYKAESAEVTEYSLRQPSLLQNFLENIGFVELVAEVNANCASEKQFRRRFFDRFNAFRVLKFLNFAHEKAYSRRDIEIEAKTLLTAMALPHPDDPAEILNFLRNRE